MSALDPRDRQVLRTLIRMKLEDDECPTWRELAKEANVYMVDLLQIMQRLNAKGFVSWNPSLPRSFRVLRAIPQIENPTSSQA